MLTQRFALPCEKEQGIIAQLSESVLPQLADLPGVVGVHLCIADESASAVETFEKTFRATEDSTPPYVLMIEGTSCTYVGAAGSVVTKVLVPVRIDSAVYQLEHSLANFGRNGSPLGL